MTTYYQQARFAFSVNHPSQLPEDPQIEVAFVGRSNAGKSSALNTLTNQKALARVSKTPGRTQLINYFTLPDINAYLVDLPGYGYANVPRHVREHWQTLLGNYLLTREPLCGIILIMDIRHPLKKLDLQMIECCQARNLPAHILLTKADKFKRGKQQQQLITIRRELQNFSSPISVQTFSSLKKEGLPTLVQQLNRWFNIKIED